MTLNLIIDWLRNTKKQLLNPMSKFLQTLNKKDVNSSINVGFRLRGSSIFTYSQEQIGFNYFYCKRAVQNDSVSTSPLDVPLCPWDNEVELVEKFNLPYPIFILLK